MSAPELTDIAIVGGGIVGLSCAWEMVRRGASVTVYDAGKPEQTASWAAAGMLAPTYELLENGQHPKLGELCRKSARLWKGFAAELEAESNSDVGYESGPSLAIALTSEQTNAMHKLGLDSLAVKEVRKLAPLLAEECAYSAAMPLDGWVDNRRAVQALREALMGRGVEIVHARMDPFSDGLAGFGKTLFATGAAPGACVSPVKGVMLVVSRRDVPIDCVVRCGGEYAVPRGDRVLIGATVGEVANPVDYLVRRVSAFLPGVAAAEILDQWQGYRPSTPDHAPCLGQMGAETHFVAKGHYRNGILLAPVTAMIMADMMLGDRVPDEALPFSPSRFAVTT